ncbi:efflux RND transporter periplasmic adaptor subunit [Thermocrinis sp.]|uniref:efflux RND transporter periplasmic adaptor subunit n=1 Tax=Thermocrinis sp. TaxID=2024383 RepID=UPI002FDEE7B9
MKKLPLIAVVLSLPIIFLAWRYIKSEPKTAVVEVKEVKKFVYASGYVEPENFVLLKAEASGVLEKIFVKEGQKVKKGQVLAVLRSDELDASLRELEARLRLTEERLNENSPYLKALKERVEIAYTQMNQAGIEYERRKDLGERGLIPKEQLERYKNNYEIYKKEYEASLNQYKDAVSSLQTERKSILAKIESLKAQKDRYVVKSPVDGVVLSKYVKEGNYINHLSQENALFGIGNPERLDIILEVDEEYAGLVREGQKVFLTLDAFPGTTFEGEVYLKEGQLDRTKKTAKVKVKASLPENTPTYSTVEGKILIEKKQAMLIPKEAVKDGKVLKYERVRTVEVPIKLGQEYEGYVEVLEGLKVGDKVILR